MRSVPFWVVSSVTTQKGADPMFVTVNGIYVMVLGFVHIWVLCSYFVDISPSYVMLDISIVDVEYSTKPYECHAVEYFDVFVLLTPCRTDMVAMPKRLSLLCCLYVCYWVITDRAQEDSTVSNSVTVSNFACNF